MKMSTKTIGKQRRGRPRKKVQSSTQDGYLRLIAFGDRHFPKNIADIDTIILQIIEDFSPHIILDGGDPICADQLSVFPKTPVELIGFQRELDGDYAWRKAINHVAPQARKILLKDNHVTKRIDRKICDNPWLYDMGEMSQESLFRVKELGWELIDSWMWKNRLLFIHGDTRGNTSTRLPVNKSRMMTKDLGLSIVRFHSHTTGCEIHRRFDGTYVYAIQLGCMQDIRQATYLGNTPIANWTHSIGVFYLSTTTPDFFFELCAIENGKTVFANRLYPR